ncbi:MAG: YlxR family protein [Firmicutes bacterium]|nr:YlxR family protein [Bacillota bacterium]
MRPRRVPQRTCVGCRQVRAKKELLRVVRDPQGNVHLDLSGKASGRGAYICPSMSCLDRALTAKSLERALERPIAQELVETLRQQLSELIR